MLIGELSAQSLVSEFKGETCFKALCRAGESIGMRWAIGDPALGDINRDEGNVSGTRPAADPAKPGYMMGMPPGYQHFSSIGRYAAAAAAVDGGMK